MVGSNGDRTEYALALTTDGTSHARPIRRRPRGEETFLEEMFPRREMPMTDADPDKVTPFENVDVDQDVDRDGRAPSRGPLTAAEDKAIDNQITEIVATNAGREPAEQVS